MIEEGIKGKGNYRHWQYMTGEDFKKIDKTRTIVTVTCSPIEVHGPHLPVIADNREAEAITAKVIDLMADRHPEVLFLRLPTIYVSADVIPHTGSLMFKSSTIVKVLADLGRTLAKQGFKNIWVTSFHGGPRHFVPIEVAADITNRKYGARMVSLFSLLVKKLTEGTSQLGHVLGELDGLTPEELDGDTHAGAIETSMLMHLLGECVDPVYKDLERMTIDLKLIKDGQPPRSNKPGHTSIPELLRGFKAAMKYFETMTYSGKPEISSPEIGEAILDKLAEMAIEPLSDLWTGKLPLEECHSPVWPLRWLFTWRWVSVIFERLAGYKNPIF